MTIRQAKRDDADVAAELIYAATHDIAHFLTGATNEKDVLAVLRQFFRQKDNRLSYQHTLIKEFGQPPKGARQVVGIIVIYHGSDAEAVDLPILQRLRRLHQDPSILIDKEAEHDEFYIDTLSVSPHFSGQGIGTALILACEDRARQLQHAKISLNVDEKNERALRLYQRLGYRTTKVIQIYHEPYLHMVKDLS